MISESHQKESLGKAYILAISAQAGVSISISDHDYGVDGTFKLVTSRDDTNGKRYFEAGFALDYQLKSTINWELKDNLIIYDLEAKNYNDLIWRFNQKNSNALILLLICLPKNSSDWIDLSEEELIIRKCCYWCQLNSDTTTNSSTCRIHIPVNNLFTPEVLTSHMNKIQTGSKQL